MMLIVLVLALLSASANEAALDKSGSQPSGKSFRDCDSCVSISYVDTAGTGLKPFYMATYETSWREYLLAADEAGCPIPTNRDKHAIRNAPNLRDDYAVSGIDYAGALCFASWLSKKSSHTYRLPTPEEWTIAATTATITSPSAEEISQDKGSAESRDAVRGGVIRIVSHGTPTRDGIYGLLDGAGEMTNHLRSRSSDICALYHESRCQQVEVLGLSLAGDAAEARSSSFIMTTYPNSYVGFRVVRDR